MTVRDLRCPGTPECFDAVSDELGRLWTDAPQVDATDRMLFETALIEIVGNLVEHARTPLGDPVDLDLQLAVDPATVRARLQDNGVWPPMEATDMAGAGMPEDELAEGGRGLAMATALAEIKHIRIEDGNIWTVVRTRTP